MSVASGSRAAVLGGLLGRVQRLELAARHNAAGLLVGDYETAFPGRGLTFREARRYVPGDPVRDIAWSVSARLGEPYVRVHHEERRRDVVVALDTSPSMHGGFSRRTKLETAVEIAATLAVAAVEAGDRLGGLAFADVVLDRLPPRAGRAQLSRLLALWLDRCAPWTRPVAASDVRQVFHELARARGRRVVFVISDFVDRDVPDDLRFVRARHDVTLLRVFDPVEHAVGAPVRFPAVAPEGAGGPVVTAAPGLAGSYEEAEAFLRDAAGRFRVATASLSTAEPVAPALGHFFHRKRRRRG